jgi:hypothetical protein
MTPGLRKREEIYKMLSGSEALKSISFIAYLNISSFDIDKTRNERKKEKKETRNL